MAKVLFLIFRSKKTWKYKENEGKIDPWHQEVKKEDINNISVVLGTEMKILKNVSNLKVDLSLYQLRIHMVGNSIYF